MTAPRHMTTNACSGYVMLGVAVCLLCYGAGCPTTQGVGAGVLMLAGGGLLVPAVACLTPPTVMRVVTALWILAGRTLGRLTKRTR